MRIIEYPPEEKEQEYRCRCGALLGYTKSDCHWHDTLVSTIKCIHCPCCKEDIILERIPNPIQAGNRFFYFDDGSWAKEANP